MISGRTFKDTSKPCKGLGIAKGHGCGLPSKNRKNGLGISCCYAKWLYSTPEGLSKIKASTISVKKQTKKVEREKTKAAKEGLKTLSDYKKELQALINSMVRFIDRNCVCISSQKPLNEKYDAGHYYSVGSNDTIRFNLLNIYAQSVYSNRHLSGDLINFTSGLTAMYGIEHLERVIGLKMAPVIKLSIPEAKEKIKIAKSELSRLKAENKSFFNSNERIQERENINKKLSIYETLKPLKTQEFPSLPHPAAVLIFFLSEIAKPFL